MMPQLPVNLGIVTAYSLSFSVGKQFESKPSQKLSPAMQLFLKGIQIWVMKEANTTVGLHHGI